MNTKEYNMPMGKESMELWNDAIKQELESFESIKSVTVEDDQIIKEEFHGDLAELSPDSKEDQYETLMNTFINRKDRRKLKRYKKHKSFTDRIYGR